MEQCDNLEYNILRDAVFCPGPSGHTLKQRIMPEGKRRPRCCIQPVWGLGNDLTIRLFCLETVLKNA